MSSGVAMAQKCVEACSALNKREYGCLVLKMNADFTSIDLEKTLPPLGDDPESAWKDFVKTLPENDARYLVTDFTWKETPTVAKSKVIMITWTPATAPIRSRTVYAASLERVTSKLHVQKTIQTSEADELEYSYLKSQIAK
ncbi:unnamed protein product [Agarophyton chilense]